MRSILIVITALVSAGCTRFPSSVDSVRTTYETAISTINIVYESKRTFQTVQDALYWHSSLLDRQNMDIASEEFLKRVVPLLNSQMDNDPELLYITQLEADAFFRQSFRAVSMKESKVFNTSGMIRFHVEPTLVQDCAGRLPFTARSAEFPPTSPPVA